MVEEKFSLPAFHLEQKASWGAGARQETAFMEHIFFF